MFTALCNVYSGMAARNPGPVFLFAIVFFGILGVPIIMNIQPEPPHRQEELERFIRRDRESYRLTMEFCAKNKVLPYRSITTTVEGQTFYKSCNQLPPSGVSQLPDVGRR